MQQNRIIMTLCLNQSSPKNRVPPIHFTYLLIVHIQRTRLGKMVSTATTIRSLIPTLLENELQDQVTRYLNAEFHDLDSLLAPPASAGPSRKKRKTLDQEIEYYEKIEADAAKEVRLLYQSSLMKELKISWQ